MMNLIKALLLAFVLSVSLLILSLRVYSADYEYLEGRVISKIEKDTYLILLKDQSHAVYISDENHENNETISRRVLRTQYNKDISKTAFMAYEDNISGSLTLLNIAYAILILMYFVNLALCLKIPHNDPQRKPFYFKVVSGPDSGKIFKIAEKYVYTIGRDLSNDIVINDKTVSRKQAEIWINPKTSSLLYKNSPNTTNPIFLNNKQISNKTCKIAEDDIISIGLTNLMLLRIDEDEKS